MSYISSRYFTDGFTFEEKIKIRSKYDDPCWNLAKQFLNEKRNRISNQAVKLTEKVYKILNIELFPLVIPVACKGFNISGGTAAFMMYDKDGIDWCFDSRIKDCLLKSNSLEVYDNGLKWIFAGKLSPKNLNNQNHNNPQTTS